MIFGRDMILPIKYILNFYFIRQEKQIQINKDNARENKHRVDYDYKVGDNPILANHTTFKYEETYKSPS